MPYSFLLLLTISTLCIPTFVMNFFQNLGPFKFASLNTEFAKFGKYLTLTFVGTLIVLFKLGNNKSSSLCERKMNEIPLQSLEEISIENNITNKIRIGFMQEKHGEIFARKKH